MGDFILQISIHLLWATVLHLKFHLGCDFHRRFHYLWNLHCKFHFSSFYIDFMSRTQISIQLATPLLDFILVTYSIMNEYLSLWLSLQLLLPSHISFQSLHCRFHFSLYFHWGFYLISHFHVHHDYISEDTSIFPTHPYQKV